jgi:TPP-dependent trihydroxycyclohexane-1,2-dione (THcHDO) dehydratase
MARDDFLTYQNQNLGITISYPSNWNISDNDHRVTFDIPQVESNYDPYFMNSFYVDVNTARNKTFDAYIVEQNRTLGTDTRVLQSFKGNIDGNPSSGVLYTAGYYPTARFLRIWTMKGLNGYTIEYYHHMNTFEVHLPIVQKMINSLELSEVPEIQHGKGITFEYRG